MDDELMKKAERSAENLRWIGRLGLISDVAVAVVIIAFKDSLEIGDIAYVIAALLVASGLALLFIFPRLPEIRARELANADRFMGKAYDPKTEEVEKK